jgi:hypothetical protein
VISSHPPADDAAGFLTDRGGTSPRTPLATAVLNQLTMTGRPWLAVAPNASGLPDGLPDGLPAEWRDDVTVIDVTATRDVAVTVNPFEPGPLNGVQAHASRLAALIEAAFRPPGPVRAVIRLALRRAYAECGWDLVTSTVLPGAAAAPGVPSLGDLRQAALGTLADLGRDARLDVAVRGFLDARLGTLWTGPAGRYLAGGHPADVAGLLARKVIFTVGDLADEEDAAFLTGVLLIRLAEQSPPARRGEPRRALVLAVPPVRSHRLRALLDDARSAGVEVIHAACAPTHRNATRATSAAQVPLLGRRSPACGLQCRQRPCSGRELHAAGLLAAGDGQVWFRLWGEALVLAFLTGRPLPKVPAPVRRSWAAIDVRTRECLLATVVDDAVSARAHALRQSYEPKRLTAAIACTAAGLLAAAAQSGPDARVPTPIRAGHVWVIPQLRWLHETDRLSQHTDRGGIAPPLDFELAGLADWPGIRVGDRLDALRRHRLAMAYAPNRRIAAIALSGAGTFDADLAIAGIGLSAQQRLRHAARILGATGWLEVVLSWPERFIDHAEPEPALGRVPAAGTG